MNPQNSRSPNTIGICITVSEKTPIEKNSIRVKLAMAWTCGVDVPLVSSEIVSKVKDKSNVESNVESTAKIIAKTWEKH